MRAFLFVLGLALGSSIAHSENFTLDAVIGGWVGAAVTTDGGNHKTSSRHHEAVEYHHHPERKPNHRFCPPGQAKKGRC